LLATTTSDRNKNKKGSEQNTMTTTNHSLFLSLVGNTTAETLPLALVSDIEVLAFCALAEINLRNTGVGNEFSFSRRDRGVGRALATKFLGGTELTAEDVLAAVGLAYRYRKQIARLLPSAAPAVALEVNVACANDNDTSEPSDHPYLSLCNLLIND